MGNGHSDESALTVTSACGMPNLGPPWSGWTTTTSPTTTCAGTVAALDLDDLALDGHPFKLALGRSSGRPRGCPGQRRAVRSWRVRWRAERRRL